MCSQRLSSQLSKKELRTYFKNQISEFLKRESVEDLISKLGTQLEFFFKTQKGIWGAFSPLKEEPPILSFLEEKHKQNDLVWVYPKVTDSVQGSMEFYLPESFELSHWGINEPAKGKKMDKSLIQGMLIPGLGFNRGGQRLGRGKGFYDRYLQDFKGTKVGIGFSTQLVDDSFEANSWDVNMDYLITEKEVIKFKK